MCGFSWQKLPFPAMPGCRHQEKTSVITHPPPRQHLRAAQDLPRRLFSLPYSPLPTGDCIAGSSCQEALCHCQPDVALSCPAATLPSCPALPRVCHRKRSLSRRDAELLRVLAHRYRVLLQLLLRQAGRILLFSSWLASWFLHLFSTFL